MRAFWVNGPQEVSMKKYKNATRIMAREYRHASWAASATVATYWSWMGHWAAALSAIMVFMIGQAAAWYIQVISDNLEE